MEKNIVLTGFMGSGKTTVARAVSRMTGMPLVDTDLMVEATAGKSIDLIFREQGEEEFRRREREAVISASSREGSVIAVGGGAVCDARNVSALKGGGVIYLLRVTVDEVMERLPELKGRPLLPEDREAVESLMSSREVFYLGAADVVVETAGRSQEELARLIVEDFLSRVEAEGKSGA